MEYLLFEQHYCSFEYKLLFNRYSHKGILIHVTTADCCIVIMLLLNFPAIFKWIKH